MKKNILIVLILSMFSVCYSQNSSTIKPNRQQTELWLSEKINKYLHKEDYYSFDDDIFRKQINKSRKNIKLKFTNESIIITGEVEENRSNKYISDGLEIETTNYIETITIPLKDITNKVFIKDGFFVFESNYNSFTSNRSDGFNNTKNWYGIRIKAYEEENFIERFNKAMNHLLSFVKKTKTSEIF